MNGLNVARDVGRGILHWRTLHVERNLDEDWPRTAFERLDHRLYQIFSVILQVKPRKTLDTWRDDLTRSNFLDPVCARAVAIDISSLDLTSQHDQRG